MDPGDMFLSQDAAALDAGLFYYSSSSNQSIEYAGWVYQNSDHTFSYTSGSAGSYNRSNPGPKPDNAKAYYHTHGSFSPPGSEVFSPEDVEFSENYGVDGYLYSPGGSFQWYSRESGAVFDKTGKTLPTKFNSGFQSSTQDATSTRSSRNSRDCK